MRSVAVISARSSSPHFSGRLLPELCGKPFLWHIWSRVHLSESLAEVLIATDSEEIRDQVNAWGGCAILTAANCRNDTECIASVLRKFQAEYIISVPSDDPLIEPQLLDGLVKMAQGNEADVITPVYCLQSLRQLTDPNVIKVVRTNNGFVLYLSRSPIPFLRDAAIENWLEKEGYWRCSGICGFRRSVLEAYPRLRVGRLEMVEDFELLRILEAGYRIGTVESGGPSTGEVSMEMHPVRRLLSAVNENTGQPNELWHQHCLTAATWAFELLPTIQAKPWGTSIPLVAGPEFQLDKIVVRHGGYCSLHQHQHKDNFFLVQRGSLRVTWQDKKGERVEEITPSSDPLRIPAGVRHRFLGLADSTEAIELYTLDGKNPVDRMDIVRYEPGGTLTNVTSQPEQRY